MNCRLRFDVKKRLKSSETGAMMVKAGLEVGQTAFHAPFVTSKKDRESDEENEEETLREQRWRKKGLERGIGLIESVEFQERAFARGEFLQINDSHSQTSKGPTTNFHLHHQTDQPSDQLQIRFLRHQTGRLEQRHSLSFARLLLLRSVARGDLWPAVVSARRCKWCR